MKQNEQDSVPRRVGITFKSWRRAPVACSLLWIGRRLNDKGEWLAKVGLRLIELAEAKLQKSPVATSEKKRGLH